MADTEETAAPKGSRAKTKTPTRASAPDRREATRAHAEAEREAAREPAGVSPAGPDSIAASGAILEPGAVDGIDVDHPAVDNNPRATATAQQNNVDFNDPDKTSGEAVADNLSK